MVGVGVGGSGAAPARGEELHAAPGRQRGGATSALHGRVTLRAAWHGCLPGCGPPAGASQPSPAPHPSSATQQCTPRRPL